MTVPTLTIKYSRRATPLADEDVYRKVEDVYRTMLVTGRDAMLLTSNIVVLEWVRSQVRAGYIVGVNVAFVDHPDHWIVDRSGQLLPENNQPVTILSLIAKYFSEQPFCERIGDRRVVSEREENV